MKQILKSYAEALRSAVLKTAIYCSIGYYAVTGKQIAKKKGKEELLWHLYKHWCTQQTLLQRVGLIRVEIDTVLRSAQHLACTPQLLAYMSLLVVSTHESSLDGFIAHGPLPRPAWVAKQTLFDIPIFGYCMRMAGMIPIDRERPNVRQLLRDVKAAFNDGRQVVFFAEGKRQPPTSHTDVEGGVDLVIQLAHQMNVPVIVATIDSWDVWGPPNTFLTARPGVLRMRFGRKLAPSVHSVQARGTKIRRRQRELPHPIVTQWQSMQQK